MHRYPRTLIIAEAGVNHNGDLGMARQLVEAAAKAGADVVKFQTFRADKLVTPSANKAAYQVAATGVQGSQYEMLRRLELSEEDHLALKATCANCGIEFLSTAFDLSSLDYLLSLGVKRLKVPSGEITNLPYLRKVGASGRQIILSTGMSTLGDIELAIDALVKAGATLSQVVLLHCTTEYPAPIDEVNLCAMSTMRTAFSTEVGYSDHTSGFEVAIAAVALGASIIEKHFTLDRRLSGPDHKASLEPQDLTAMIKAIRNVELAMGDGVKQPTLSEKQNSLVVRKSLVAACSIQVGETFTANNLTVKRPGTGISPMRWDEVVGTKARRNFSIDEVIEL